MDIRIETLPSGKRKGTSVSSEYERKNRLDYADYSLYLGEALIYKIKNKEVQVINTELLPDGDYKRNKFEHIAPMAPICSRSSSTPVNNSKGWYRYIGNES